MLIRVRSMGFVVVAAAGLFLSMTASAVDIDWATVGSPGNAADTEHCFGATLCFGAVATSYRISKTEVTNAQYAEFLNAVAATDTHSLYNTNMAIPDLIQLRGQGRGGITRSGNPGSFSYAAIAGRESMPVNYVSFHDSLRFSNWLHNGQGSGDTETGAYTITPAGISANSITRNANATIFLPSEDEWYKAAFFNGTSYFDFPMGSDQQPFCSSPQPLAAFGNCSAVFAPAFGDLTPVGSYTGSASPNGTFDQGGNVWEWNEAVHQDSLRLYRGGAFSNPGIFTNADSRIGNFPTVELWDLGFRVASLVPEPSTSLLIAAGMLSVAMQRRRLH